MIIICIVLGMATGWILGNYFLDKWINNVIDDIDEENKKDTK